jgi:hypothetical protein
MIRFYLGEGTLPIYQIRNVRREEEQYIATFRKAGLVSGTTNPPIMITVDLLDVQGSGEYCDIRGIYC